MPATGKGVIYSYTRIQTSPPIYELLTPSTLVVIDLEEGREATKPIVAQWQLRCSWHALSISHYQAPGWGIFCGRGNLNLGGTVFLGSSDVTVTGDDYP